MCRYLCCTHLHKPHHKQLPLPPLQLYDIDFSGTQFLLVPVLSSKTDAVELTAPIWTLAPSTHRCSTPDKLADTEDALSAHLTAVVQDMAVAHVSSGQALQLRGSSSNFSSTADAWQIMEPVTVRVQSDQRGCSTTVDVSCR
jgi:hypothetical protein